MGQSISEVGSSVSLFAIPTLAITVLGAGPLQIGLLGTLQYAAFPLFGIVAGVYVDRLRCLPLMIVCDVGRFVLLASIPMAWGSGHLHLWQLYIVAMGSSLFTVLFDVAYQSYVPSLLVNSELLEGNAKLSASRSLAQLLGPALAGGLIQLANAARAVLADATSYLFSAALLWTIRHTELRRVTPRGAAPGFWAEAAAGLRLVIRSPALRTIGLCSATSNFGFQLVQANYLVFVYLRLGQSPSTLGLILAVGGAASFIGVGIAGRMVHFLGQGRTLIVATGVSGLAWFLVPAAGLGLASLTLLASSALISIAVPIYDITQLTLRQSITPDHLQGRVNATMRTINWSTIPLGYLVGGAIGATFGVIPALVSGAAIATLASAWAMTGGFRDLTPNPAPVGPSVASVAG